MKKHLQRLENLVDNFYTNNISRIEESAKKNMKECKDTIYNAFVEINKALSKSEFSVNSFYVNLLEEYNKKAIYLDDSIIVTHDEKNYEFPIRISSWKQNWENILT